MVSTVPPRSTSPLDSTTSSSGEREQRRCRGRCRRTPARSAPAAARARRGRAPQRYASRSRSSSASRGCTPHVRRQLVELLADPPRRAGTRCAPRAAACCAGCARCRRTRPRRPGSPACRSTEARSASVSVSANRSRRMPSRVSSVYGAGVGVLPQLGGDVVVAAGRGQHQRGVPADRPGQRVVGGGVAGVQREHHVGALGQLGGADVALHEGHLVGQPSPAATAVLCSRDCALHVDAGEAHRQPAHVGQVARGRRRSGRRCRSRGRRPAAARSAVGARSRPEPMASSTTGARPRRNSSTWRYFACRVGLTRPCCVGDPERHAAPGRPRRAAAAWRGRGRRPDRRLRVGLGPRAVRVQHRLELLGHPQLVGLGGGLDVPVAERLVEQVVDRVPGRRRRARGWTCAPGSRRTP